MIKINVSFCFDKNLWKQAVVTITSLLQTANKSCCYNIYAVISKDISEDIKKIISDIVFKNNSDSTIKFLTAKALNKTIDHSPGYYFRLQLQALAKNIDKIIYCDIDTLFLNNLVTLWNFDMKDNIICGIKDGLNLKRPWKRYQTKTDKKFIIKKGCYVNSGVLLLNLKSMRRENMYEKFMSLIGEKIWQKDQDILNYVCFPKIGYLPLKYNFTPRATRKYNRMVKQKLISANDIKDAKQNPIIYHFINYNPWDRLSTNSWMWWRAAAKTPFYNDLKRLYLSKHKIWGWLDFILIERKFNKIRV